MQNRRNIYNAVTLNLCAPEPERIQAFLGRDVLAMPGKSLEVFRGGRHYCSLRVSDDGMGPDTLPSKNREKLRTGDLVYTVDLATRILYLADTLTSKDGYNPSYTAEITIRVNNPTEFVHHCFQGMNDRHMEPIVRFQRAVERAFRRYAESVIHDKMKRRDLESAAFKNRVGRELGIWIERSVVDEIVQDPHRVQVRSIEKQDEVNMAMERSKAKVEKVKADEAWMAESRKRELDRQERSKDARFDFEMEARKQAAQYQQKLRDIIFNTVQPQWAEYILQELDRVDNSIPEFFRNNPQILQYYPDLSQLIALPQPSLPVLAQERLQNKQKIDIEDIQRNGH